MTTPAAPCRSFAPVSDESGTTGGSGSVVGILPVNGLGGWYRSTPHAQPAGV
jgi:hypothetical protein